MEEAIFKVGTKLDLRGFDAGRQQLVTRLKALEGQIKSGRAGGVRGLEQQVTAVSKAFKKTGVTGGQVMVDLTKGTTKATGAMGQLGKQAMFAQASLGMVARRVFLWGSATAAIFGAIAKIREAIVFTMSLEDEMIELKKVLPKAADLDFFKGRVFKLAELYGVDPIEVAKNFKVFAQAGLDANEVIEATNAALLAVNATGATTEEAFDGLIAAIKTFNLEWTDAVGIIDKVMRLQADYVVESVDLINAIKRIGPAVKAVGGNLDDLLGMITAIAEVSRISGTEAANALKFMFTRLGGPETQRALQRFGIFVKQTPKEMRPLRHILRDLAERWKEMGSAEKMTMATSLAGARQYPRIAALLDNWDGAVEAITKSQFAWNDALDANIIQMESTRKITASAAVAIKEFGMAMVEYGLIGIIIGLTTVLSGLATAMKVVGPAAGGFLVTWIALMGVFKVGAIIWASVTKKLALTGAGLLATGAAAKKAGFGVEHFTKTMTRGKLAAHAFGTSLLKFASSFGIWLVAIPLVISVVNTWLAANKKASVSVDELSKSIDYLTKKIEPLKKLKIEGGVEISVIRKVKTLESIMGKLGKTYRAGRVTLQELERAFRDAGIETRNLTTDFNEQQRIVAVLTAAYNLLSYDSMEKIKIAHQKARESILKYTDAIKKSLTENVKVHRVYIDGGRQIDNYGRVYDAGMGKVKSATIVGTGKISALISKFKELGVSFKELERKLMLPSAVVTSWEVIDEAIRQKGIGVLTQAIIEASSATKAYEGILTGLSVGLGDLVLRYPELQKAMEDADKSLEKFLKDMDRSVLSPDKQRAYDMFIEAVNALNEAFGEGRPMDISIDDAAYNKIILRFKNIISATKKEMEQVDLLVEFYKEKGIAYDADAEKMKVVENAKNSLLQATKALGDLTLQYTEEESRLTKELIAVRKEELDLASTDIERKQTRLSLLTDLLPKMKDELVVLLKRGKLLSVLGSLYDLADEKATIFYEGVIKASEDYQHRLQSMSDFTVEYYRILGKRPIQIYGLELSWLKKMEQEELNRLQIEFERGKIDRDRLVLLEDEIHRRFELQKMELTHVNILEKVKDLYGGIEEDTENIRDILSDWLTDMDAFVEDLQKTGSGLRVITRLLEPLGKMFLQRQAEILVKMIIPDDAGKVTHQYILSGHKIGGQIVYDDIIAAFSAVQIGAPGAVVPGVGVPGVPGATVPGFPGGDYWEWVDSLKATTDIEKQMKEMRKRAAMALAGQFAGAMAGAAVAKAGGREASMVGPLTTIGGMLGMVHPVLGIVGAMAGGIVGGLIGDKLEDIAESTTEVVENTSELVDRLSPAIFSVPSSFTMPKGISYGGGVQGNVIFNIQSSDPQGVGREVNRIIDEKFGYSQRRQGYRSKTIG